MQQYIGKCCRVSVEDIKINPGKDPVYAARFIMLPEPPVSLNPWFAWLQVMSDP
jgi:hypothetical protein